MRPQLGVLLLVVISSCTPRGSAPAAPEPSSIRFVPQLGHTQRIEVVALSSDGRHAVTAEGEDGDSARLWDLETGTLLRTFTTDGQVKLLGFSRDDRKVIVGGAGGRVAFHDIATGTVSRAISIGREIRSMAIAPDRSRILASSEREGNTLQLWDATTGALLTTLVGPHDENNPVSIDSVAFAPDGTLAASSDDGGTVRLWSLATTAEVRHFTMPGVDSLRTDVAFSQDGRQLVGSVMLIDKGASKTHVWDVNSGREEATLDGHGPVAFTPGGQLITVDSQIRLWDVRAKQLIRSFGELTDAAAISQDGRWLFCGREQPMLYDLSSGAVVRRFTAPQLDSVSGLAFSPDGKHLIVGGSHGVSGSTLRKVRLTSWDLTALRLDHTFAAAEHEANVLRVSSPALTVRFIDKRRFIVLVVGDYDSSAGYENWLATFDLESRKSVRLPGAGRRAEQDLELSDDGRLQVVPGDRAVRLYDTLTGEPRGAFELQAQETVTWLKIALVDVSPDGRRVLGRLDAYSRKVNRAVSDALFSRTESVALLDRATERSLATFAPRGENEEITVLRWSPDGSRALVGLQAIHPRLRGRVNRASTPPAGNTLEVWDVERRTLERGLNAGWVADARFLRGGKHVLVAGFDGLTLWDVTSGQKIRGYRSDALTVQLAVSVDERFAAATCNDGTVRMWRLDTGASVVLVSVGERWVVYSDDGMFDSSHEGLVAAVFGVKPRPPASRSNRPDGLLARMGLAAQR